MIGTMMIVDLTLETGTLLTRNGKENTYENAEKISGESFLENSFAQDHVLPVPLGAAATQRLQEGIMSMSPKGPDYETIYAFGSNCDV